MPLITAKKDCLIIALVQCESIAANPEQALDNMDKICAQVQCDLIIFPEMYLSGYNIPISSLRELGQDANGQYAQAVGSIAQKHKLHIIFGYPEKVAHSIYNSAQLISPEGDIQLNYRKTHLFGKHEHECFHAGKENPHIATVKGWNLAIQICYDIEFPENARIAALTGADVIAVPTANMLPFHTVCQTLLPARALENQVFIAYANYCGTAGNLNFCGHSTLTGPDGSILAQNIGFTGEDSSIVYGHCHSELLAESRSQYTYLSDRIPARYSRLISE